MARGRLISRTLGSSRKFAALMSAAGKLGEFAQTLYPLLVPHTDDFGRLSGDAFTVKHAVFPTSRRREDEFEAAIQAMVATGLIVRYEAEGQQVIEVVDFKGHQPGLSKRTASRFPDPPVNFTEIREFPSQEKRTELKGREEKGTALSARFERFWQAYPKKVGKDAAEREWNKLAPGDDLTDAMIAAVRAQRASEQWRKDGGQFIPHPRTWLHQGRWKDAEGIGAAAPRVECPHEPKCNSKDWCALLTEKEAEGWIRDAAGQWKKREAS